MSILGRSVSVTAIVAVIALMVFAALLPAASRTPAREITLVARGMALYLEGDPSAPNPTIKVKAGERVRIVLRNEDRGMTHDFAVPSIEVGLNAIKWNERGEIAFDVPATPGRYEYVCRPHLLMMRGTIQVE